MVGRKGNPKYKTWRRLRVGKGGVGSEYYTAYIKNKKTYSFPMDDGGRVTVFAMNKKEALKEANRYQKWRIKKGFVGKVDISKGKLEKVL